MVSGSVIYVLQGNETVCLDGQSYQKEILLSQEFVGGMPNGVQPIDYFQGHYSSLLQNVDGTLYSRCPPKGFNSDFFTYLFPNFPVQYQGDVLKAESIIPSLAELVYHYAIYDKEHRRFLWIYAGAAQTGNSVLPADYVPQEGFLDYNNTGGATILYSSYYNERSSMLSSTAQNLTLYSLNGEIYAQQFTSSMNQNLKVMPAKGIKLTGVTNKMFPDKNTITGETKFFKLKTNRQYLFYATNERLYWYDYITNQTHLFYTFENNDVVVAMSSNPQESELGILLESGKFVVLDIQNENLMGNDNKIYEIDIPGDKMIDMGYKFPDYNQYTQRRND